MNFNRDYLESIINTASREQLMLMLFDGAIRFIHQGRQAIEEKNWEKASYSLIRSQNILGELMVTLDTEAGEFAQGSGYFFGLGVLRDSGGNDRYLGRRYAQGSAAHQAIGVLFLAFDVFKGSLDVCNSAIHVFNATTFLCISLILGPATGSNEIHFLDRGS